MATTGLCCKNFHLAVVHTSQVEKVGPKDCKLRHVKYLNSVIEQGRRH